MAYSDAVRTAALIRLASTNYNWDKVSDEFGVTARQLRNWEKNFPKKTIPELVELSLQRLFGMMPEKFSGDQWAITVGILIDKYLLMCGQATSRSENIVKQLGGSAGINDLDSILAEADRILAETADGGGDYPGDSEL